MIGASIKEQLRKLVELQKIDHDVFTFKRELKDKPILIEELKHQFEEKKSKLKKLEEELKILQVEQKNKEIDLKSKEDLIVKTDAQLLQLKSNKDYQTKLLEIESIKADKSIIEEKILLSYDAIDNAKKKIEEERGLIILEEKKFLEQKRKLDEELDQAQANVQRLEGERRQILPSINPEFLARYDRILNNRDGLALVPVKNHSCGGCYMNVPDQVVNQIKRYDQIIYCEMCARLLYLEEEL